MITGLCVWLSFSPRYPALSPGGFLHSLDTGYAGYLDPLHWICDYTPIFLRCLVAYISAQGTPTICIFLSLAGHSVGHAGSFSHFAVFSSPASGHVRKSK